MHAPAQQRDDHSIGIQVEVPSLGEHALRLLPSSEPQEGLSGIRDHDRPIAPHRPETACQVEALQLRVHGVLVAAVDEVGVAQVVAGAAKVVGVAALGRDRARLLQVGHARLQVPAVTKRRSQTVERVPFHRAGADLPGDRDRLFAACLRGPVAGRQHEHLAVRGQRPRALGRGPLGGGDRDRLLHRRHGRSGVACEILVAGQPLQQGPGPHRLDRRVGFG